MIYLVEIEDGDDLRVELSQPKRGAWQAKVGDNPPVELELKGRAEDGGYLFAIAGEVRKFHLDKNCTTHLFDDGEKVSRVKVEQAGDVVLEHDRLQGPKRAVEADTLESNITGIVLEVLVEPGQEVVKGQPIIIIEAMKMENTLVAPTSGEVTGVEAEEGQTVYAGDLLVSFE